MAATRFNLQLPSTRKSYENDEKPLSYIIRCASPLIATHFLQYGIPATSLIFAGNMGSTELAALGLGMTTANVTGYIVLHGLGINLEATCGQAYGAGQIRLVGVLAQRMILFLWGVSFFVALVWPSLPGLFGYLTLDASVLDLATAYLKTLRYGLPAFVVYESGKRYLRSQCIFQAGMYTMAVVTPSNFFLQWYLIRYLGWGFVSTPIATVISQYMAASLLIIYSIIYEGSNCWPGWTSQIFSKWGPMLKLSLLGLAQHSGPWLAFEAVTYFAARLGPSELAAQAILTSLVNLSYQVSFGFATASSTRVAQLVGSGRLLDARKCAAIGVGISTTSGLIFATLYLLFPDKITSAYSHDKTIRYLTKSMLPLLAIYQSVDSIAVCCNGILRGLGRQKIAGTINLLCCYLVGLPLGMTLAFLAGHGLEGLWVGLLAGLILTTMTITTILAVISQSVGTRSLMTREMHMCTSS